MKRNENIQQVLMVTSYIMLVAGYMLLMVAYFMFVQKAHAITPTATPSAAVAPTKTAEERAKKLLELVSEKVGKSERRGMVGTVSDILQTQITLTDLQNTTRVVDVDELTKFASPSAKESFGISDISKGTKLGILGLYNSQSKRILSRFVSVVSFPVIVHGQVTSLNATDFTIDITDKNKKVTFVDIENITRTNSYSLDATVSKAGFSKIKEGMRVIIVGVPDKTDPTRILARRVLLFPDISPNIKTASPSATTR